MEIAYFDRGPVDATRLASGGYWSTYWYNGHIYGSEMARGLDVFELVPSAFISENEIEAAKSVHLDRFNVQGQVKFEWPATVSLARAYLDQLERGKGMEAGEIAAARQVLADAEQAPDAERREGLTELASRLEGAAKGGVAGKVRTLAGVVRELGMGAGVARGE
jgi:hypothetical protein